MKMLHWSYNPITNSDKFTRMHSAGYSGMDILMKPEKSWYKT